MSRRRVTAFGWVEPIADAPDRVDGLAGRTELAADARDVGVDRATRRVALDAQGGFDQLVSRHGPPWTGGEVGEDIELMGGQLKILAASEHLSCVEIEGDVMPLDELPLRHRGTETGAEPCCELFHEERLGQVVRCAESKEDTRASRSVRAVKMSTGMELRVRTSRRISWPSAPGSIRSSTRASKVPWSAAVAVSCPWVRSSTSKPSRFRPRTSCEAISGSSSTTKMR